MLPPFTWDAATSLILSNANQARYQALSAPDSAWLYSPFYCEENAWHAVAALASDHAHIAVLCILGRSGHVAVWRHRLAARPSYPLVWDYHVVALARESGSSDWAVFDPDSTLPWGLSARTYLAETFPPAIELLPEYQPCFRWFDGREYQRRLNATRRHMRNADGTWQAPPPLWPLIRSKAPDAFDLPELRNADCCTLPPPLDLSQLYSLLCSGAAPAVHS